MNEIQSTDTDNKMAEMIKLCRKEMEEIKKKSYSKVTVKEEKYSNQYKNLTNGLDNRMAGTEKRTGALEDGTIEMGKSKQQNR